jgi:hypothetical protein
MLSGSQFGKEQVVSECSGTQEHGKGSHGLPGLFAIQDAERQSLTLGGSNIKSVITNELTGSLLNDRLVSQKTTTSFLILSLFADCNAHLRSCLCVLAPTLWAL